MSTSRALRVASRRIVALALALIALLTIGMPGVSQAQEPVDPAQQLAERFAPVVMVTPQDHNCDTKGEPFRPSSVDIVLDNPEVFLRQVGNDDPVAMRGPSAADIYDLREGWYLDFPGDALRPGCIFEQDFNRFFDGESVVYAHIATEADRPGYIAVQYWFFWYYNPSKNDHEGDWEFIQLLFEADTVEQALTQTPVEVGFAQHTGGERSDWDDEKLEKDGDRPVVYPAVGSHATYYEKALFLGRSGHEGFGCDNTERSTERVDPTVVLLPDRVTDPDDPLAWLAFKGRWGQRESGFFNGPTGPYAKWRWYQPVTWSEGLRNSSVSIPGGADVGDSVVSTFCSTVAFGSTVLATSFRSPTATLAVTIGLVVLAVWLARRTRWSPVVTEPIRQRRGLGQIMRAAVRVWRDHPLQMLWVGLVYVPIAFVSSLIQVGVQNLPFVEQLIDVAGDHSGVSTFVAVFVGGIGNLLAFVYVSAAVARTIDREHWSLSLTLRGPLAWIEIRQQLVAVVRAAVIVLALLVSVVGIPWGIRQLIRYQMAPQAIATEGIDGIAGLRRSSELVRGRWWWTAAVIGVMQAVVGIAGVGLGFVLLLVTSLPLWLFNVLTAVIYVILVPVGAAAMTYVYGTLCARRDEQSSSAAAELVSGG